MFRLVFQFFVLCKKNEGQQTQTATHKQNSQHLAIIVFILKRFIKLLLTRLKIVLLLALLSFVLMIFFVVGDILFLSQLVEKLHAQVLIAACVKRMLYILVFLAKECLGNLLFLFEYLSFL
jgi:hypothetical protein